MNKVDNLKQMLEKSGQQHSIMIWGASKKSDEIVSLLKGWNFRIVGFIDRDCENIREYKGYPVYNAEKLKEKKYFVCVALQKNHKDVIDFLELYGYKEFTDYWYPGRLIKLDGTVDYEDLYGNLLITKNKTPVNVFLRGGGQVTINAKKFRSVVKITSEGASDVIIGENIAVGRNVSIKSTNGHIKVGNNCIFADNCMVRANSGGWVQVGDNVSFQSASRLGAFFRAKLVLMDDCMVSYHVFLRAGNGHNIVDLDSKVNLDANTNRDVIIGKHVWIGMRATIMNGVAIGSGACVGANSFVCKKKFPPNCCLAGNPAKVLRKRIAWIREASELDEDMDDYLDYIYDEN